jgi:hypothetical protein
LIFRIGAARSKTDKGCGPEVFRSLKYYVETIDFWRQKLPNDNQYKNSKVNLGSDSVAWFVVLNDSQEVALGAEPFLGNRFLTVAAR